MAEDNNKNNRDDYEKVCYVCRRSESKAGPMVRMPGGICRCQDCLQKSFDAAIQLTGGDLSKMMPESMNPSLTGGMNGGREGDGQESGADDASQQHSPFFSMVMTPEEIQSMLGRRPMPKSVKKAEASEAPKIDMKKIPAPHRIAEMLSDYVVGQDHAKKAISVAVYNHYKRLANADQDVEIEKSNMLMIGPTGSGKTFLVKTLARLLDVPLAIADATALTEAGYIGDDIESVVTKLLAASDNDVARAEQGIIYIDEIDKLARKRNATQRDVSGESVQQGLLKLLEGAEIEVPVGANSKNAMVPLETVNTKNILFICGGAFPDLEDIIKERLNEKSSMGFNADLKDKYNKEKDILKYVTTEDIRKFGMIPEFIGRLPVVFTLSPMDKTMLIRVLKEPKNAVIKQYQKLLQMDEVKLEFAEDAYDEIAEIALKRDTGARALRSVIEDFMLDIMFEIPKDPNIGTVTITGDYIRGTGGPLIGMRG
ncbi:MAG: ATP-dependent Clp protease ATP-binding subunit ClpX [Lachnospiraceae bacterium]|nr:ATP-dependent Clp protease ATP-binding subunit ClpX [Lachnospiraceae bacterium]